jgi:NAD(P)-dependent dehydrogenase (short-subunit alcohol dehydrogenase family)
VRFYYVFGFGCCLSFILNYCICRTNIKVVPVNNAGTINRNNRIWEVPEEEFDTVIDTNVKGIANMLRHFIPLMLVRKQGIIVNMSSGWGRSGAALVKFTRCSNYLYCKYYPFFLS